MLRTGSVCMSFLYNSLTYESKEDESSTLLNKRCRKLRCLSDTLQNYGGVLSKISQMLSLDDHSSAVFSECSPFQREKTIDYFKEHMKNNDHVDSVDFSVYKSGSVGQVHIANYKGKKIVFKVQYVGIAKQTQSDLDVLDKLTSYLYSFSDLENAMVNIKAQMYDELNYVSEVKNQQVVYELYQDDEHIEIPKIIPELCSKDILSMYFVEGESLDSFIKSSTQEEKNFIGIQMARFIFKNIYVYGLLYADIHYGNFLIRDKSILCVLDFGCLQHLSKSLRILLRRLHLSIKNKDKEEFYRVVEEMGIIDKTISSKSKEYIYDYFCTQNEPWVSDDFEFTEEWLDMATEKDTELMKEWTLPKDMVYFNKIPYGGYHVFTKLKLRGNFSALLDEIFDLE